MASGQLPAPVGIRHTFKRYSKFLIVGAANSVVDLAVLNGLLLFVPTKSPLVLAGYNTAAVVCAIVNSYVWNRKWTFSDASDGSRKEQLLFILQAIINLIANDFIVYRLSSYLVFSRSLPVIVSSNASKGMAMMISSLISYVCMRLFVFRGKKK